MNIVIATFLENQCNNTMYINYHYNKIINELVKLNIPYDDIAHLDCNGSSNEISWTACYNKLMNKHKINNKDKSKLHRKQYMQRTNDLALGIESFCCGMN